MIKKRSEKIPSGRKKIHPPSHPHGESEDLLTDRAHHRRPHGPGAGEKEAKPKLGDRIRQVREMRGLTLQDLSSRTGIGVEDLKRIESNQLIPPLGELIRLGKAVEMQMGYFISPGNERDMSVVRAHARTKVSRYGENRSRRYGYYYESLAPEKAHRSMEPFLVTMVPTDIDELSSHDGQEFIFVLEGEISARVGDQSEILHPGDAIYYDSNRPHLITCWGKKPAKILAVLHTSAK